MHLTFYFLYSLKDNKNVLHNKRRYWKSFFGTSWCIVNIKLLLIAGMLTLISCNNKKTGQSEQKPGNQDISIGNHFPVFDGIKAYSYLKAQTDFGPRNPGSIGHEQCLHYLSTELKKFADDVSLQSFEQNGYGETLKLTNIFGSFNTKNKKRILLLAHWDSRPRAEMDTDETSRNKPILGANDGASGVAVLLELARLLKTNPPPVGVDILFTDGEDYGNSTQDGNDDMYFLGAKYFAGHKLSSYTPQFGILLDMIGDRDLQIPMEQHSMRYAPQVVELVWKTAEENNVSQFVNLPGENISDDHLCLNEAGIPTIDLIDFDFPYWHTHQDTPDKCSPQSLEAVGKVLSALIFTKF
jgi:glutaminyl-peptide cyclotransferase